MLDEQKYDWLLSLGELPDHPYIFTKETEEYFLKVKRPKIVECPSPPTELIEWLKPSWKLIDKELDYLKSKNIELEDGSVKTIFLDDLPHIVQQIDKWELLRSDLTHV